MSAKEMFEKLSLEQIRNDDNYIEYVRNGLGGYISILFSLRWKTIKPTYGYQARGINCHEITLDELKAIVQQAKELGWLQEEQKEETNYEHYKDEIIELYLEELAISKGKMRQCSGILCSECDFADENGDCIGQRRIKEWIKKPYQKQTFKLTKFEIDLLQSFLKGHPLRYQFKNINALTEMKEKGYFKGVDEDATIEDILAKCEVIE
jgi:hypothetical protein